MENNKVFKERGFEESMRKKKEVKQIQGVRCSNCGSTLTYIRRKHNQRICRACGYIEFIRLDRRGDIKEDQEEDGGSSRS